MHSNLGSVTVWLRQLPAGEHEAQEMVFRRYQSELVGYAAYRLRQLGVCLVEAEDIAQEVFMNFFRRTSVGQMLNLDDRETLWLKLQRICGDRVKDARRKRSLATESAIDSIEHQSLAGLAAVADQHFDECILSIEHSLLHRYLTERSPDLPEIASLRMQGYTIDEIAEQLRMAPRTVDRRIAWIDQLCDEYRDQ